MKKLPQTEFKEPDDLEAVAEEPLVIHKRPETANSHLIICVHGLGGSRYGGDKATWGKFPQFVFEDIPELDVGLYEYRTLFRRLKFWKSVSLSDEAKVFADIIRDELSDYKTVILAGHSMGGLLCKAVISYLLRTSERNALSRIGGLILMATPQLGSIRVPRILTLLSPDFRTLKAHSSFVAEITETFQNHLYTDERINAVDKIIIPTWAILGASDFWVDQLSSGIGLTSNRRKIVRGSHTEIVKPKNKESDVYSWVRDRIKVCLSRFKYDVYISVVMAGLQTDEDYRKYRTEALQIEKVLKEKCNFQSIFYAGRDISAKAEFDAQDISLEDDLRALRESRYYLLIYPEKVVSSVLFEAGLALALGKPSVYFVRDRHNLPFLMAKAGEASLIAGVKIYECGEPGEIHKLIERHRENCGSGTTLADRFQVEGWARIGETLLRPCLSGRRSQQLHTALLCAK